MRSWFLLLLIWNFFGLIPWDPPPSARIRAIYAVTLYALLAWGTWHMGDLTCSH